jgi:hypothetical protein
LVLLTASTSGGELVKVVPADVPFSLQQPYVTSPGRGESAVGAEQLDSHVDLGDVLIGEVLC